jgi:hypothetical protein
MSRSLVLLRLLGGDRRERPLPRLPPLRFFFRIPHFALGMAAPSNVRIGVGEHWSSGSPSFAETGGPDANCRQSVADRAPDVK